MYTFDQIRPFDDVLGTDCDVDTFSFGIAVVVVVVAATLLHCSPPWMEERSYSWNRVVAMVESVRNLDSVMLAIPCRYRSIHGQGITCCNV